MTLVHLSSIHASELYFRQTPQGDGQWQDMQVVLTDPDQKADWLIVYDRHQAPLETRVPKERRVLILTEPPEFQDYPAAYLDFFGTIYTPYELPLRAEQIKLGQPGLQWFYGSTVGASGSNEIQQDWNALSADKPPLDQRPLRLTAICSTKAQTLNQVRRLRFLKMLKAALGDDLHIYGRGFDPLADKAELIDQSQMHLALENSFLSYYWSEKLADPILGQSFPIYAGTDKIDQFFNLNGMLTIDLTRPRQAVRRVQDFLKSDILTKPDTIKAMRANKDRLLNDHNLFALLHRLTGGDIEVTGEQALATPQSLVWKKPAKWKRMLKIPKLLKRWFWQLQIFMLERD